MARILVIEDGENNQKSARALLREHDLTVTASYGEAYRLIKKQDFDVVLSDCQLLPDNHWQKRGFIEEAPLGSFLVILAMIRGIKKICLFTDTSHHDGPIPGAFDAFGSAHSPRVHEVGDMRVLITCNTNWVRTFSEDFSEVLPYGESGTEAKDWREPLALLSE